jgi:delta24-sterol reductase
MTKESILLRLAKFIVSHIMSLPALILAAPVFKIYDYLKYGPPSVSPNSPEIHRRKVERVQAQIKAWNKAGRPNRMCTARKAWKTLSVHNMTKSKYTQIQIDDMEDVVEVDLERKVVTVEPGMMMGKLTNILIPMGWTVPVLPEFESLTVGGVTCGGGLETSSHRYGLFADTLIEIEIVLASGKVVTCSREENSDLFYAIPWSHGTLGFVTAVKIPLIPAKR